MSFYRRAWHAGAEEYGRKRAETYGRRARVLSFFGIIAIVGLVMLTIAAAQGSFGG